MAAEHASGGKDSDGSSVELLDIRMPGDPRAIASVSDQVSEILSGLDVPEDKRLEIVLALQEALANAVVHGCNNNPSEQVHCELRRDVDGRILIIVTDPGPGFPPDATPDPMSPENLYGGSGRGIFLIHQLMDEVQFESGGNQLKMWKY